MRRVGTFVLFLMLLCGIANATNFDYWFPWIYRYCNVAKTNAISPDGSVAVSNSQHEIYLTVNITVINTNLLFTQLADVNFPTNLANDGKVVIYDFASNMFVPESDFFLLLETGDHLLLETGDMMILE